MKGPTVASGSPIALPLEISPTPTAKMMVPMIQIETGPHREPAGVQGRIAPVEQAEEEKGNPP
jgi:hypothetical protein